MPRIAVTSVFVNDQAAALTFYRDKLGFQVKHDIPLGEARWLTLVSPQDPDGTELLLEPDSHPVAKSYQQGLFAEGIPAIQLGVEDLHAEHDRLTALGARFTMAPTDMGQVTTAVIDDTCGNLVQLAEYH